MIFQHPLTRRPPQRYHESSPQRSMRDGDATGRQWIKNRSTADQAAHLASGLIAIKRQVEKMRRRIVGSSGSAGAGEVAEFQVVSLPYNTDGSPADYVVGRKLDGLSAGSEDVNIIKVPMCWPSRVTLMTNGYTAGNGDSDGIDVKIEWQDHNAVKVTQLPADDPPKSKMYIVAPQYAVGTIDVPSGLVPNQKSPNDWNYGGVIVAVKLANPVRGSAFPVKVEWKEISTRVLVDATGGFNGDGTGGPPIGAGANDWSITLTP